MTITTTNANRTGARKSQKMAGCLAFFIRRSSCVKNRPALGTRRQRVEKGPAERPALRKCLLLQALEGFRHELDELRLVDCPRGELVVDRRQCFLAELLGEVVLVPAVDLAGRRPGLDRLGELTGR